MNFFSLTVMIKTLAEELPTIHSTNSEDEKVPLRLIASLLYLILFVLCAAVSATDYIYHPEIHTVTIVDSFENMLNGFYLSQGWKVYEDFVANHTPGVYLILALGYQIFGVSNLHPSIQLFEPLQYSSYFITLLFQQSCLWASCRLLGISRFSSLLIAIFASYGLAHKYNLMYPLSETFLMYSYALIPVIFFRLITQSQTKTNWNLALATLILFPFITNFIGLTFAPSSVIVAAFICLWILVNYRSKIINSEFIRTHWQAPVISLFFILTLAVLSLFFVNIDGLIHYNIPFNSILKPDHLAFFKHALIQFQFDWYGKQTPLFFLPTTLLLASIVGVIIRVESGSLNWSVLYFLSLFSVGVFCLWRVEGGYKSYAIFGMNISLLILIAHRWIPKMVEFRIKTEKGVKYLAVQTLIMAVLAWQAYIYAKSNFWQRFETPQSFTYHHLDSVLQNNGICSFSDPKPGCQCLRLFHFEPLVYVHHNVRQCKPDGIWIPNMNYDIESLTRLKDDIDGQQTAFVVYDQELHQLLKVPGHSVRKVIANKTCERHFGRFFCFNKSESNKESLSSKASIDLGTR